MQIKTHRPLLFLYVRRITLALRSNLLYCYRFSRIDAVNSGWEVLNRLELMVCLCMRFACECKYSNWPPMFVVNT